MECYEKAIKCEANEEDCGPHYREASICIKDVDTDKYLKYVKKAIDIYSMSGRTSTAAGMSKDCA